MIVIVPRVVITMTMERIVADVRKIMVTPMELNLRLTPMMLQIPMIWTLDDGGNEDSVRYCWC